MVSRFWRSFVAVAFVALVVFPLTSSAKPLSLAAKKKQVIQRQFHQRCLKLKRAKKVRSCPKVAAFSTTLPVHYPVIYDSESLRAVAPLLDNAVVMLRESICVSVNGKLNFHIDGKVINDTTRPYCLPLDQDGDLGALASLGIKPGLRHLTLDFRSNSGAYLGFRVIPMNVRDGVRGQTNSPTTPTPTRTPTSTATATPQPQVVRSGIGINVEGVSATAVSQPFKNLMRQASSWMISWDAAVPSEFLNSDGWPIGLPNGRPIYSSLIFDSPYYAAGRYVLRFRGTGKLVVRGTGNESDAKNFSCPSSNYCEFDVTPTMLGLKVFIEALSSPITDIEVYEKKYEGTFEQSIFQPAFLRSLGPKPRAIRFLDWTDINKAKPQTANLFTPYNNGVLPKIQSISGNKVVLEAEGAPTKSDLRKALFTLRASGENVRFLIDEYDPSSRVVTLNAAVTKQYPTGTPYEIFSYSNREWSERPRPGQMYNNKIGVPLEYMIRLCNEMKASPWLHVPVAASDDYVRSMATLVRDTLDPSLEVYFEYSNEYWNFSFPHNVGGAFYAFGLQPVTGVGPYEYYALRSTEIFKIWNEVFGAAHLKSQRAAKDRLRRVLGVQSENAFWNDNNRNGAIENNEFGGQGVSVLNFSGAGLKPGISNPFAAGTSARDYADAVGLAVYFNDLTEADLDAYEREPAEKQGAVADGLFNRLFKRVDFYFKVGAEAKSGLMQRWHDYAAALNLDIVSYEAALLFNTDAATPSSNSEFLEAPVGTSVQLSRSKITGDKNKMVGRYIKIMKGPAMGEVRRITAVTTANIAGAMLVQIDSPFSSSVTKGTLYKLMTARHFVQDRLSYHESMRDLYEYFLGSWRTLGSVQGRGATLLNQYPNAGGFEWSYLPLLERLDLPFELSPKFRAYAEFQAADELE